MISSPIQPRAPPIAIVTFDLGEQRYGLFASEVIEVQRAVAMSKLPRCPAVVEGIIDLRGMLAPVLDVRLRFGLPPSRLSPSNHLVIARLPRTASAGGPSRDARVVAIRVDRARDLVEIPAGQIEDASAVSASRYTAGIARLPDGLVLVHDLRTFFSLDEELELDRAIDGSGAA
jgi:purine-binding chemotaxis protein CheW